MTFFQREMGVALDRGDQTASEPVANLNQVQARLLPEFDLDQ
jgi:hypothetical protein